MKRYLPVIKFFLIYTVIFIIFVFTAKYTAPFLLGLGFAIMVQPLYTFMRRKLSFKGGFAAAVITTIIFALIIAFICWIAVTLVSEVISFIANINKDAIPLNEYFGKFIDNIAKYLGDGFLKQNSDKIFEYFSAGIEFACAAYTYIISLFTSIPAIFTMIIVAIFSTYYFTHDFIKIKKVIANELSYKSCKNVSRVCHEGADMLKKFFKSYIFIYSLTFFETLVVFLLLQIKYPIFFAVLTAVADVVPILGPGTVYLPLGAIYLLSGNYFVGGAIIASFVIISIIRQFVEPKIISNSIKIHPLLSLTAIYFSLVSANIWVLVYLLIMFIIYQVLVKVDFLPPLFASKSDDNKK